MKLPVLTVMLTAFLFAEPLAQGERDRAMSHFHATRKVFLDSLAGVPDAQWNFKPSPERWSIAECAEHIAVSEDSLFDLVKKIMQSPATPEKKAEVKGKDEMVIEKETDRTKKAQAPEFLKPSHRWPNREALIAHFKESRDRNIAYLQTTQDDLRSHFRQSTLGLLDAYQWMLLISAHSERHTAQLNEVKADSNFPKR